MKRIHHRLKVEDKSSFYFFIVLFYLIDANSDTPEPSQEFLLQKLESGSSRLWHEIQQKMKIFILDNNMSHFKFEAFIQVLKVINR
jgi:hypothetical protein